MATFSNHEYNFLNKYRNSKNNIITSNTANFFQDNLIPSFQDNSLLENTIISKYKKDAERILNSFNKNINKTNYNNFENTSTNVNTSYNRSRSCSPCNCECHYVTKNNINYIPYTYECFFPKNFEENNYLTKNYENKTNENNFELLNEVVNLKKDYDKMKTELEKTKNEKDASVSYILELEKEMSNNNIKSNKLRDISKYHEMLNKSFEVLDSVSNKCDDINGKTKGGSNYYYNKEPDYNNLINAQKNFINKLPDCIITNPDIQSENYPSSNFSNQFPNSNLNVFKHPYGNKNQREKLYESNINNTVKNNPPYKNANTNNDNDIVKPTIYKISKNNSNDNKIIPDNSNNSKIIIRFPLSNQPKEKYKITDIQGNPIYTKNKKLFAMKMIPLLDKDGKEILDKNGNLLIISPTGEIKTLNDLEPIVLDNDLPLVNTNNKPYLGLKGIPLINKNGKPFLGPGELYDSNNKVIKGVIGILPTDRYGNLILCDDNNENNNLNKNIFNKPDVENNKDRNLNLRSVIGKDGKVPGEVQNKPIILDENNIPVKNSGTTDLLDKNDRSNYDNEKKPILISDDNNQTNNFDKENINNNNLDKINKAQTNDSIKKETFDYKKHSFTEPNQNYQQRNSYRLPFSKTSDYINDYSSSCFACEAGCGVSVSGYSIMNYSPYDNRIIRRDYTPLGIESSYYKDRKKSLPKNSGNDKNIWK